MKTPRCHLRFAGRIGRLTGVGVVALFAACASYPRYLTDPVLPGLAEIYAPQHHETDGKPVLHRIVAIDGLSRWGFQLAVGPRKVEVETRWSNGWTDAAVLALDAVAGRKYVVLAYELAPGQDPARATLRPRMENSWGAAALEGAVVAISPLIVMTAAAGRAGAKTEPDKSPRPPDGRPFAGCCFVWIEELESGRIVDGTRPPGLAGYWPAR